MGHLDNFRNMTSSFGKSRIEQQTILQIQPGALVNPMSSSRQFDKYNQQRLYFGKGPVGWDSWDSWDGWDGWDSWDQQINGQLEA